jgi:toxin ParE1/3/4
LARVRPVLVKHIIPTPRALAELADILAYIAEQSPQGARKVQARIQAITSLLVQYPCSGQLSSCAKFKSFVQPHLVRRNGLSDLVRRSSTKAKAIPILF